MKLENLSLILIMLFSPLVFAVETVLINKPLSENDVRYIYTEQLLIRVLRASQDKFGEFEVVPASKPMSRDRTLLELQEGSLIHVIAEAPKPGWEELLLPVRIPIRKGVQGFRVFIIHKSHQDLLNKVKSLADLQKLPTGSGAQWSTRKVMEEAGFNVVTGTKYSGLFDMLNKGRFITFGRGVNEAYREVNAFSGAFPDLVVDDKVALFIPLPTYYFVTPTKPKLAERITYGLEKMISDGSFEQFFYTYHCEDLLAANLSKRKVFAVNNSNLSEKTPLNNALYWFKPNTDISQVCDSGSAGIN